MASRSWNRVELIGNLTRDPELRYTANGVAVVTFGVATNRTYVTDGEKKEEVDFHRIVAWNKLAELCNQLLKKGNRVFVSGRLQTRSWEAADGQTRQVTEIVLEDMILLSPKVPSVESTFGVPEVNTEKDASSKLKKPVEEAVVKAEEKKEKPPVLAEETPIKENISDDDLPF